MGGVCKIIVSCTLAKPGDLGLGVGLGGLGVGETTVVRLIGESSLIGESGRGLYLGARKGPTGARKGPTGPTPTGSTGATGSGVSEIPLSSRVGVSRRTPTLVVLAGVVNRGAPTRNSCRLCGVTSDCPGTRGVLGIGCLG